MIKGSLQESIKHCKYLCTQYRSMQIFKTNINASKGKYSQYHTFINGSSRQKTSQETLEIRTEGLNKHLQNISLKSSRINILVKHK